MTINPIHTRRRISGTRGLAIAAAIAVGVGATAHANEPQIDPTPWTHCAYSQHPVTADIGAVLPPDAEVSEELRAVLHGEVHVGTDCSLYDGLEWPV